MEKQITRCPRCEQPLLVTELTCDACGVQVRGRFERGCRFCALEPEHRRLLDVFLSCRGVLRDMEQVLGLSYPTVRNRVDALLAALGYAPSGAEPEPAEDVGARRQAVLDRLQAGEITPEEAAVALRQLAR